jgi:two-component system sensor histidine kinase/response regulator
MDVQMPVMDGFEATAAIRAQEGLSNSHTEIIAMTANAMSGDRERCIRAGMDSYLSKPLQPAALLEKLAAASGRRLVSEEPPKSVAPKKGSFDIAQLDESCGGSVPLKLRVIERYLATSLDSVDQIGTAIAGRDAHAAKSSAHALKGSSLTIGATKVGSMCQELETIAMSSQIGPESETLVVALRNELIAVNDVLSAYAKSLGQPES